MLDRTPKPPREEPWRRLSGLHTVRGRKALAVARELWTAREDYAREQDIAPGRLVPDRALVAALIADPKTKQELAQVKEFTGRASRSPAGSLVGGVRGRTRGRRICPLERAPGGESIPPARAWSDRNPDADARLKAARPVVEALAEELDDADREPPHARSRSVASPGAPPEPVSAASIGDALAELGARPWQIAQTAQLIADAFVRIRAKPAPTPRRPLRRFDPTDSGRIDRAPRLDRIPTYGGRVAEISDVFFVDGMRTPFGRAGEKGMYWNTRADDLAVKATIGLMERNPGVPADRIDDVAIAATSQTGDQGLTLGRSVAHPRRAPADRARLRDRPHVRGRDDERHDDGRLDRHRHVRPRPRRRRRAHGSPPDRRQQRRPEPAVRRREAGRPPAR